MDESRQRDKALIQQAVELINSGNYPGDRNINALLGRLTLKLGTASYAETRRMLVMAGAKIPPPERRG